MTGRMIVWMVVACVVGAGAATLLGVRGSSSVELPFQIERPFHGDIVKTAVATGAIVPRREVALKPRVSGVIERMLVEPGQVVAAATPIAHIRIVPNVVELSRAESELREARLRFSNLQSQFPNAERLFAAKLMPEREFNEHRVNLEISRERLKGAQSNRELLSDGASRQSGKVSNVVSATLGGTVLEVTVQEGGSVIEANNFNEGTTIATIADMRDMVFVGRVDQSDAGQLQVGMPVLISVAALGAKELTGRLEYVAPKGKLAEGAISFEVRASVDVLPDVILRANYGANARITLGRHERVLALPERLVSYESGKAFVEVVKHDGASEQREVHLGLSDGISVEVSSGVVAGEQLKVPN